MGAENLTPTGTRSPDRPTRSDMDDTVGRGQCQRHSRGPYYARSIDKRSGLMSLKYDLAHKL